MEKKIKSNKANLLIEKKYSNAKTNMTDLVELENLNKKSGINVVLDIIKKHHIDIYNSIRTIKHTVSNDDGNGYTLQSSFNEESKYWFLSTDLFLTEELKDLLNRANDILTTYCWNNQQAYFELVIAIIVNRNIWIANNVDCNKKAFDYCLQKILKLDSYKKFVQVENDYSDYMRFEHTIKECIAA